MLPPSHVQRPSAENGREHRGRRRLAIGARDADDRGRAQAKNSSISEISGVPIARWSPARMIGRTAGLTTTNSASRKSRSSCRASRHWAMGCPSSWAMESFSDVRSARSVIVTWRLGGRETVRRRHPRRGAPSPSPSRDDSTNRPPASRRATVGAVQGWQRGWS